MVVVAVVVREEGAAVRRARENVREADAIVLTGWLRCLAWWSTGVRIYKVKSELRSKEAVGGPNNSMRPAEEAEQILCK